MSAIHDRTNRVLPGRAAECRALREMVDAARSGRSEVRVLLGEPGIGKTALLKFLRDEATDCTVLTAVGVESDMELAFAGLQQLCAPILDHRSGLPQPQREALERAFGLSDTGTAPNRFLVGLSVLGLLAAAAEDRPVLCLIDDVQWLDQVSAQTLFFVARRVQAESVGLAFASRTPIEGTAGLPTLAVGGLDDGDARRLLESTFPGRLDAAVLDRAVAEARGNPLALLQTPKDLTSSPAETVSTVIEEHYRALVADLPADTRMSLLIAAAEPVGDPALLSRALAHLDLQPEVVTPASDRGLIAVDTRVQFYHPMARSAAYRSATAEQRRLAHAALAAVTDPAVDPDRRAWHRALAADSLDEHVALDLERSATRALQRGGTASAAAFLTRAVELTPDPSVRTGRALAAAEALREIASFGSARRVLATADLGPLTDLQRARSAQLRTRLAFASARADGDADALVAAVSQFTTVAGQLHSLDATLATEAYLEALSAAMYVGRAAGDLAVDVATTARAALATGEAQTPLDLVTHALAERLAVGAVEAMPAMRRALDALKGAIRDGSPGWFWRAFPLVHDCLIHETWDDGWRDIAAHAVRTATDSGAVALLPSALLSRAGAAVENGELATATALVAEANDLAIAIDYAPLKYHGIVVAAWRGDEAEATALVTATLESGRSRGEGRVIGLAHYAAVVLNVGLGRYSDALTAGRLAGEYDDLGFYPQLLAEMVEAGVRGEDRAVAEHAFDRLRDRTQTAGTPRALGALTRSHALLSDGEQAEASYLASIRHYGDTNHRIQTARSYLLYGEWLRRNGPATVAREPLRVAHREFVHMGALAFAERARRELQAAGQKTRKQPTAAGDGLSPQERQIAELAGQGLTNQEIAGQLFISAHTVEWHLRKVFTKLSIRSRRELRQKFL